MPVSVTPVLNASAGYEQDVPSQVASLVRFFIMNPGDTSDLWEDSLVSFRKLVGEYEHDPQALASRSSSVIRKILNNKFKNLDFVCDFTTSDYKDGIKDGRYRIRFDITYSSGSADLPALISGIINVNSVTNEINVNFNRDGN